MSETPFIRLKNNLNKVNFSSVEPEYKQEYIRAFSRVLERLDSYFRKNDLYSAVDYDSIVDQIINTDKLSFHVATDLSARNWAGVHIRHSSGKRNIAMGANYMFKDTTTEGVLCHEFFHHLTLGPDVLKYSENDKNYEVVLPVRFSGMTLAGSRLNVTERRVEGLDSGSSLDGGFICEGLTELCKQQLYSKDECYHSYTPQTAMVKFLNNLTANELKMKDFLRGDLPGYVQKIGYKNFQEFVKCCDKFQDKYEANALVDYRRDEDYISAQDVLVKAVLNRAVDNKTSVADYSTTVSRIINNVPVYPDRYKDYILAYNKKFVETTDLSEENKAHLNKILDRTVELEYSTGDKFPMQEVSPDLFIKTDEDGFAIVFDKISYKFKKEGLLSSVSGFGSTIKMSPVDDHFVMTITNKEKGIDQSFKIKLNENGKGFAIINQQTNQAAKYDVAVLQKRMEKEKENNITLLQNFEYFNAVKNILQQNQDSNFYAVKKVTTLDNKTYIIARSSQKSMVFEQVGDKFKRVEVVDKKPLPESNIHTEVYTSKDQSTALRGFLKTGEKTDSDSFEITLQNGTKLARYFDENGRETFGEVAKLSNEGSEYIVKVNNVDLYDKTNVFLNGLLGLGKSKGF